MPKNEAPSPELPPIQSPLANRDYTDPRNSKISKYSTQITVCGKDNHGDDEAIWD